MKSKCKYIDIFLNFKRKIGFCLIFALFCSLMAHAQKQQASHLEYIARYHELAQQHRQQYGIPASITLAQGLLESNAGRSYLATRGNNHFGIKCHNWSGESVEYDDTLRHACYRKYDTAEQSFVDHARFLKGKRYAPLYQLEVTDYRGWAAGLRECGYAEDNAYPQKLVSIIEQYELYKFDTEAASESTAEVVQPLTETEDKEPITEESTRKQRIQARVAASFDNE